MFVQNFSHWKMRSTPCTKYSLLVQTTQLLPIEKDLVFFFIFRTKFAPGKRVKPKDIFFLDLKAFLGRATAQEVLKDEWKKLSEEKRDFYRFLAKEARQNGAHWGSVANLPPEIRTKNATPITRAWDRVQNDRSLGIGEELGELEHFFQALDDNSTL